MLKFIIPDSIYSKEILSAELSFEAEGEEMGGELSVGPISNNWNFNDITYYDIENDTLTLAKKYVLGTDGKIKFDLTDYMKDVIQSNNNLNGFILDFKTHIPFKSKDDERCLYNDRYENSRDERANLFQCDTLIRYGVKHTFTIGDILQHNGDVYSCTNLWCNSAGYVPGSDNGDITWGKIGDCIPRELKIYSSESKVGLPPELTIVLESSTSIFNTLGAVSKNEVTLKNNNLIFPAFYSGNSFKIVNVQGRIIKKGVIERSQINISSFAQGIYSISIKNRGIQFSFMKK